MIDDHGHPFALEGGPLDLSALTLDVSPDEGADERRARLGPSRLWQEMLTVRLAARLGCEPGDLSAARAEASKDWRSYVCDLFQDAGITALGGLAPGFRIADGSPPCAPGCAERGGPQRP